MVHILVIDDNLTDRLVVKRELERQFSQLQTTKISDDRLFGEALKRGGFHLVINDYQLRRTNGLDVLKTIKASYPESPIVMFTNTGNEEIAVEAMKSGLDDYTIESPKHCEFMQKLRRNISIFG
ncbi:MAG TPA: response regulator [Microcoleus sp.]|nr:response regulator [Microcoleus sp.]